MRMKRTLLGGLLVVFALIQFIRPDRSVPAVDGGQDLRAVLNPPAEVSTILDAACYDCHSYRTRYPWYSEVAPVSWWLSRHINEAREHLNFSTFGALPPSERSEILAECSEVVLDGEMPLSSYTWAHPEARLSSEQRRLLAGWFSAYTSADEHSEDEVDDDEH